MLYDKKKIIIGKGGQKKTGRGQGEEEWQWDELRGKRKWQDSHNDLKSWREMDKQIQLMQCLCVYSTARVSRHSCVCLCLCVWQTSLSCLVCLWSRCCGVITAPPPLLSSLLAWLSLLIQRATDRKLISASRVSSLELIQQKHSVWTFKSSFNERSEFTRHGWLIYSAKYRVNIKMTNRGGGSLIMREAEVLGLEGHILLSGYWAAKFGQRKVSETKWNKSLALFNSYCDAEAPGLQAEKQQRTNVGLRSSQVKMFGSK